MAPRQIFRGGKGTSGAQEAEPLGGGQGACLFSSKIVIEALPEHVFPC